MFEKITFFLPLKVIPCQPLCNGIHNFDYKNDIIQIETQSTVCLETDIIICPTKWKLLCKILISYYQYLDIVNLNQRTITRDYQLLANSNLRYLRLGFIDDLNGLDNTGVNNLFQLIIQSTNLKELFLKFKTTKQQQSMKGTINFNFTDGSLSKLQHLSIIDESNILNPDFLKLIEKAIIHPTNEKGYLRYFTVRCILNEQVFPSITNILQFNKDSLQFVCIGFQGRKSFNRNSSINLLENSLVSMTKLIFIQLMAGLIEEKEAEAEEENTQLEMQRNTQTIQPNLETEMNDATVMSCFSKRSWVNDVRYFIFEGSLSLTSAIDLGVSLGNSHNLKTLSVTSDITITRIITAYCLNFSKSIKEMDLTLCQDHIKLIGFNCAFKENSTLELLKLTFNNTSLGFFLAFCSIIKNMRNLKRLRISSYSLKLDCHEDSSEASLKKLFTNISKITSLESIYIYITFEIYFPKEITTNPRDIYLPLNNHPSLRRIELYFSSDVKLMQFYKELALGLICYTRAKIILGGPQETQQIIYEYELNLRILTLTTLQFYKALGSFLDFHPRRHLEDLYF